MAGEDPDYIHWLRLQPCVLATFCGARSGPPHHARHDEHGPIGVGQRAHDRRAIAICPKHHDDFHDFRGVFRDMSAPQRRAWMDEQIASCNAAYERSLLPLEGCPF